MRPWSSRTPVHGPDDGAWWEIKCHRHDAGCLKQAHFACPNGYEVKERDKQRYLLIRCDDRGGKRIEVKDDCSGCE